MLPVPRVARGPINIGGMLAAFTAFLSPSLSLTPSGSCHWLSHRGVVLEALLPQTPVGYVRKSLELGLWFSLEYATAVLQADAAWK